LTENRAKTDTTNPHKVGTTGQPGHRHGITELQREKDIRRAVASVIVITGYLRTGDSDFTVDLHRRSQPANSCTETMTTHANRRPHARTADSSDSDDDHHKGNMQDLRRPCPKEHLGHAGKIRLPKPEPRPKLLSTPSSLPNRNQRPEMAASANYTAKMPQTTRQRCRNPRGEDAAIHWSPGYGRLRDDAPKEEEDVKTPSSPAPADQRFPSGAKAAG